MPRKKDEQPNFEAALEKLNEIVATMEQGELPLEAALKQFEQGIKLTRQCQQALKSAEQKVQILMKENGQPTLESFDNGSN